LGAILGFLIWGGLFAGIFWLLHDYFEAQTIFGDWIALIAFVVASLASVTFAFLWIDVLAWNDK
jgi:hypothetical protein